MGRATTWSSAANTADTVFGDDGDDWIEGGDQNDLLQGDNGAPFQDDPNTPGHDVIDGDGGNDDYDAEGGDDIMIAGPGIERSEGMLGFDWVTHKTDPSRPTPTCRFTGLLPDTLDNNRDRFDLVEALSGWNLNDTLRGDDQVDADMVGHELTAEGIARIAEPQGTAACGDGRVQRRQHPHRRRRRRRDRGSRRQRHHQRRRLAQRAAAGAEPGHPADLTDTRLVDNMGAVQADVFAGRMDPGSISIVRTIETAPAGADVDTAVFSGPRADYDVTRTVDGLVVNHARGLATDGIDTVRNVEALRFSDQTVTVAAPAPTAVTATAGVASATVTWTLPVTPSVTGFVVRARTGPNATPTVVATVPVNPGTARSTTITGLAGVPHTFTVASVNQFGEGPQSAPSAAVTPVANVAPTVTARTPLAGAINVPVANNITATFSEPVVANGVNTASFAIRPTSAPASAPIAGTVAYNATTRIATLNPTANLAGGTNYTVTLTGGPTAIRDLQGTPLANTSWTFTTVASVPGAPVIGTAVAGTPGGAITATANWNPPASDGGSPITGYRVRAQRVVVFLGIQFPMGNPIVSAVQPATARSLQMTVTPIGSYRFTVEAINALGTGPVSANSNLVAGQ